MSAVLVSNEKNKAIFTVEVEAKHFEEAIQKAYQKNKHSFSYPGFRKGKVPRKILERNYGEGLFYEDAINLILPDAYEKAIEELELDPIDHPQIDLDEIEKGKPVKIKFEVDVKPIPTLGDYKNIELPEVKYEVKEEDVDRVIERELNENARLVVVEDRKSQKEDTVNIDFVGYVDGEKFPGGESKGYDLELGSNSFIPGFEDQLEDKATGEEVKVHVKFPEDYPEESLKGKEADFDVTINSIKTKELPELDDDFIMDISEFDTVDEYRADAKEKLEEEFAKRERIDKENKALEKLIEISEVDVPDSMIERQIDQEIQEFKHRLQGWGMNFESYIKMSGTSEEAIREDFRVSAEQRVKGDLVLDALVEAEKLEANDEEIEEELLKVAEQFGNEKPEEFVENIKNSGNLQFFVENLLRKKAMDTLVEFAKFTLKEEKKESEEQEENE